MINGELKAFTSSVRKLIAKAELYNGSALDDSFDTGDLVSFTIDRTSEAKFFGFGIGQKVNIKIRDVEQKYNITTNHHFKITIGSINYKVNYVAAPLFYVTEVHRDEKTNQLSVTAYDALYKAANHYLSEIEPVVETIDDEGETVVNQNYISSPYTIREFAAKCGEFLGVEVVMPELPEFELYYENGANFEGTETFREALDDVAEATQTFYFINYENKLVFKRPETSKAYTIDRDNYIELNSKTNRRLSAICSTNELGDALEARLDQTGTTQYVRDNAFWDLREDRATLVENALAALGGLTINQFECSWRGSPLVEPGDCIALVCRNGSEILSYLFNDTITYDGGLSQKTSWEYKDDESTAANSTSLGEVLKKTYAKVDKQEQRIDLVVTDTDEKLSQLSVDIDGVSATVSRVETVALESLDAINGELAEINRQVSATMSAEEIEFLVSKTINTGVESVETTTGFTFDEEGLTISKSDSNISTTITEDGMKIKKGSTEVLTADNGGVKAIDLHATTYLLIGTNSRFEDYDSSRTGCFWIGG